MKIKHNYRTAWSEEDKEFVGLCEEFPGLSWCTDSEEEALKGIKKLVGSMTEDLEKEKQEEDKKVS